MLINIIIFLVRQDVLVYVRNFLLLETILYLVNEICKKNECDRKKMYTLLKNGPVSVGLMEKVMVILKNIEVATIL